MDSKKWFQEARFGFMLHWGLYSLLGGEWQGRRCETIGEWIQSYFRIPGQTYASLAKAFNPVGFQAEEWVRLAKNCGMHYLVLTSKHHEGFALYHSEVDAYNIYDATPFKRDPIAELAEACYKHGLKLGLYYSQDLDWHDPDGGGYLAEDKNCGVMSWTNDWDYPDVAAKDYSRCFERKIKPQVREILTKFGDLCLIWFDTPRTISPAQSRELYDLVKEYQPGCLINSRIGNGLGDYTSLGDNQVPAARKQGGLYETAATLNDTWGYKSFDQNWKNPGETISLLSRLAARDVNYLLNVGPDHLGRIPARAQAVMNEVGRWMDGNAEAIIGSQPNPFAFEPASGPITARRDCLYFHLHHPEALKDGLLRINGIRGRISEASLLSSRQPLVFSQNEPAAGAVQTAVQLPPMDGAAVMPVIKLAFAEQPDLDGGIIQQPDGSVLLTAASAAIRGPAGLDRAAAIAGWTDESVELSWPFRLYTAGTYQIEITSNGCYKEPWTGGHDIRVTCAGRTAGGRLTHDGDLDSLLTRYCTGALSNPCVITLPEAGPLTLALTLDRCNPADAGGFKFVNLRLRPIG